MLHTLSTDLCSTLSGKLPTIIRLISVTIAFRLFFRAEIYHRLFMAMHALFLLLLFNDHDSQAGLSSAHWETGRKGHESITPGTTTSCGDWVMGQKHKEPTFPADRTEEFVAAWELPQLWSLTKKEQTQQKGARSSKAPGGNFCNAEDSSDALLLLRSRWLLAMFSINTTPTKQYCLRRLYHTSFQWTVANIFPRAGRFVTR